MNLVALGLALSPVMADKVMDIGREIGQETPRVGSIIIRGNTVTQQRVILNQLGLYPGQVLRFSQLEKAKANLARLGIFDENDLPRVRPMPRADGSPFVDILVQIHETRTGIVSLACGMNSHPGYVPPVYASRKWSDVMTGVTPSPATPPHAKTMFAARELR